MEMDVEAYLRRRHESQIADVEIVEKEDLNLVSWVILLIPCVFSGVRTIDVTFLVAAQCWW